MSHVMTSQTLNIKGESVGRAYDPEDGKQHCVMLSSEHDMTGPFRTFSSFSYFHVDGVGTHNAPLLAEELMAFGGLCGMESHLLYGCDQ